jgi:molybdenum cofactor cytidylyltransferase
MISGVVLAAGTASRFGATKQLVEVGGKPLVRHPIDALRAAGVGEVIVIVGHDEEAVRRAIPEDVTVVSNRSFREGQASSLAAALHQVADASEAAVVLLADQPGVSADDVRTLIEGFRDTRARIVRLRYRAAPGPALLSREVYGQAGHLHGDAGARVLMASHPEWVHEVTIDRDAPPDIDVPSDLDG